MEGVANKALAAATEMEGVAKEQNRPDWQPMPRSKALLLDNVAVNAMKPASRDLDSPMYQADTLFDLRPTRQLNPTTVARLSPQVVAERAGSVGSAMAAERDGGAG